MNNKKVLLFLTQSLNEIKNNLNNLIEQSLKHTSESLYIYINPVTNIQHGAIVKPTIIEDRYLLRAIIANFYEKSFKLNPNINVNCLLNNIATNKKLYFHQYTFQYDLILTDAIDASSFDIKQFCSAYLIPSASPTITTTTPITNIKLTKTDELDIQSLNDDSDGTDKIRENLFYKNGICAGTFDRIHIGHKILLSESVLLIQNKLFVGVTDRQMLSRKLLCELIEPLNVRIGNVEKFLHLIAPHVTVECAPITDPFGPSITERDYQCLVVSKETIKGGNMVNLKRQENNLDPLDIHVISLIDDMHSNQNDHDELKVSSSNQRKNLLGTLLRKPYAPYDEAKPYVIGLTGGLASGKSSIRKRLEKLGAATIDCDLLGHRTYEKNSPTYKRLIEIFGEQILDETNDFNINRRKLGSIVFADKNELKKLTDTVWPEILNLINGEINKLFSEQGKRFIIVEAALLIEAEWYKVVNEIWVCVVPTDEAVRRTIERDGASEEKARSILNSQIDNEKRVSYANVVLSTLWEPEYTQKQVEKAWSLLELRTI